MDHLPVEVLLKVFSFVSKKELVTTIPQVCRRWKEVSKDPSLFRTLNLVNDDPDTETAIKLLRTATLLTSLTLSGRKDTDVLLKHIGVDLPRLLTLVIDKCRGSRSKDDVSELQLRYLLYRCTTLQEFSYWQTPCNSKVLSNAIGENLRDLRVLEITYSLTFDSKALDNLTSNCNRIAKIKLYCKETISENAVCNFCGKFNETLTSFALLTAWTDASLAAMSRCRNVEELTLYYADGITDDGIMSLCRMPNLMFFTIVGSRITSTGLVKLFEHPSMKTLVKLTLLYFVRNIDDMVVSAISHLPKLKYLEIMASEITDEGLLSMSNIPNLTHLRLSNDTKITSPGWIRFFETSNVQEKMTHLNLPDCKKVSDEVEQVISQNLPNLQEWELNELS